MRNGVIVLLLGITAACSGDGSSAATTATTAPEPPATTTSTAAEPGTASGPATTVTSSTTASVTSTIPPVIDVELSNGEVTGPEVFEVALGDRVDLWVVSDIDDEMHVHGYDIFVDLEAGVPFNLGFVADVPGVFAVEVHAGHTRLFDIEVAG